MMMLLNIDPLGRGRGGHQCFNTCFYFFANGWVRISIWKSQKENNHVAVWDNFSSFQLWAPHGSLHLHLVIIKKQIWCVLNILVWLIGCIVDISLQLGSYLVSILLHFTCLYCTIFEHTPLLLPDLCATQDFKDWF